MILSHSWMLHFLWLIPLAGFILIVQNRRKRKDLEQFADEDLLKRLVPADHKGRYFIKSLLLIFSLTALIFSLAGPRWGSHYQEVSRKGVDIMLLVDVSPSMMVEDVKPSRLERARREIIDLLKVIQGDRAGLVAFSGTAFVQCPLTLDYAALQMFLTSLRPGIIPVPGTDIGTALEVGLSAFDFKTETDKVILLITDGEDNENRGLEMAREAFEKGVKIFVFGIGDTSGGPVPSNDGKGGFRKDKEGKLVLSRLDERTLKNIASVSDGVYVRSMAGDLDLDILYFDGIKEKTEAQTLKSGKIKVYEEHFTIFALAAFLFLLLEGLIDEKRGKGLAGGIRFIILLFISGLIPYISAAPASAAEKPDDLYREGRFEEAEKAYTEMDMDNPKDIRYRYNRGCSAYQNGRYDESLASFSSVMRRTEDDDMRFRAAYNMGNSMFKQGDFESAVTHYKTALIHNPENEDAQYNLELALRALEKQKKNKTKDQNSGSQNKENDKGEGKSSEKDEKNSEKSQEKGTNKKNSEEIDKEGKKSESQSGPESEQEQGKDKDTGKTGESHKEETEDLSGDLSTLRDLPEKEKGEEDFERLKMGIDKKKAEALLDNIDENPEKFMLFKSRNQSLKGLSSGKDW